MFAIRPRLAISESIARTTYDGEKVFVVKIVNRSWWKLYDIHTEFAHVKYENVTGGQNIYSTSLYLLKDHLWFINSLYRWRTDVNAEYAALCVCLDDLDVLWTKDSIIEFRVMVNHAVCLGMRGSRRRFYRPQTSIREGSFKFGNSLEID